MGGKNVGMGKSENSKKVMDTAIVMTAATELTQDLNLETPKLMFPKALQQRNSAL